MRSYDSAMTALTPSSACPWPPSRATSPSRTPCRDRTTSGIRRLVVLGGLEDRGDLAAVLVKSRVTAALGAGRQLVAQPDVGERAADHHLVVAAARAVGVEVPLLDAVLGEVACPPGESFLIAPAGLMWSVVTESPSLSSTRAP